MKRLLALVAAAAALGGAGAASATPSYSPVIDPADFVGDITNPYVPLEPGTTFVYEGTKQGKLQRSTLSVTRRTITILGVRYVVVRDTVTIDGEPVERALDWYAQDRAGNVWYFGEDSRDFEDGRWVRSDGSGRPSSSASPSGSTTRRAWAS